jgi:hypothetical protein
LKTLEDYAYHGKDNNYYSQNDESNNDPKGLALKG